MGVRTIMFTTELRQLNVPGLSYSTATRYMLKVISHGNKLSLLSCNVVMEHSLSYSMAKMYYHGHVPRQNGMLVVIFHGSNLLLLSHYVAMGYGVILHDEKV